MVVHRARFRSATEVLTRGCEAPRRLCDQHGAQAWRLGAARVGPAGRSRPAGPEGHAQDGPRGGALRPRTRSRRCGRERGAAHRALVGLEAPSAAACLPRPFGSAGGGWQVLGCRAAAEGGEEGEAAGQRGGGAAGRRAGAQGGGDSCPATVELRC